MAKAARGTWAFRYELVMLRNAQIHSLAISQRTPLWE